MDEKKTLSLDEALGLITDIARDESNRDQFKALKMLASANSASIMLPEPMDRNERMERLGRIMKGCGYEDTKITLARTFSRYKSHEAAPTIHLDDLTPEQLERVRKIKSIPSYNRFFGFSKSGLPKGYPKGQGKELQASWLKREALKIILDREQAVLNKQALEVPETPDQPSWFRKKQPEAV